MQLRRKMGKRQNFGRQGAALIGCRSAPYRFDQGNPVLGMIFSFFALPFVIVARTQSQPNHVCNCVARAGTDG
jgi:hypothetical protein